MTSRIEIIAEAGLNHLGDPAVAMKLADMAKDCGADVVKFQMAPPSITHDPGDAEVLARCELTPTEWEWIFDHCAKIGIEFLCTPFTVEAVAFLVDLGVKRIKIASPDIVNQPLLEAAAETGLPLIVSMGAADGGDLTALARWLYESTERIERASLLHCVSGYPTPVEQQGLGLHHDILGSEFDAWGLSDHSPPGETIPAIMAVALGARIVERHITLRRGDDLTCQECRWRYFDHHGGICLVPKPTKEQKALNAKHLKWVDAAGVNDANQMYHKDGTPCPRWEYRDSLGPATFEDVPDAAVSDNPDQFRAYVHDIRKAESAMGDGAKVVQPCEEAVRKYGRRGADGVRPRRGKR